ncbi:MAG: type I-A CRISPR-associated protein Cas7/Csa2 [Desulfurococcaceae archaeon]
MNITLSTSIRVLVNAEALNMAESVGNYTRHRKAPIVLYSGGEYSVIYAPAVSGEALAHGYQQLLAQIGKSRNLPVTMLDQQGYFLKFSSTDILNNWYPELASIIGQKDISKWVNNSRLEDIEKAFLKASIVADIGGFLLAEKLLKRTSAIRFSYMVPTLDALTGGGAAITPQLHVRYAPPEIQKEEQAIIYVESGSALYTFTAELVASDIGKLFYSKQSDPDLDKQKCDRVKAAIDALISLIDGILFGAKRSRYMPLWNIRSIVVTVSNGPVEFIASPGLTKSFIKETYERAVALTKALPDEEVINIYTYCSEEIEKPELKTDVKNVTYEETNSHTEALLKAKEKILELLKCSK